MKRKKTVVTGQEIDQQERLSEFQIIKKAHEEARTVKQMADRIERLTRVELEKAARDLARAISDV